jgi:hypothetical protein
VENLSPAEDLPTLYRAILDGIAELERLGERRAADRVRTDAIRFYSRSWDSKSRRHLEAILRRTERTLAEHRDPGVREVRQTVVSAP